VVSIILEDLEIPLDISGLDAFRCWTRSAKFPENGRIDYVCGNIEVSMSPEELYSHGRVKVVLTCALELISQQLKSGELYVDSTRVVSEEGNLSAEPDLVFVSYQSLKTGLVVRTPGTRRDDAFIELTGGPDMIAEIVSDSSVAKDTVRLPAAYYLAGVTEYWLVDARNEEIIFNIFRRGEAQFDPSSVDSEGFAMSEVFRRSFRLIRNKTSEGYWHFELQSKL